MSAPVRAKTRPSRQFQERPAHGHFQGPSLSLLPTRIFPSFRLNRSMAPLTRTPYFWNPYRPVSCSVVRGPPFFHDDLHFWAPSFSFAASSLYSSGVMLTNSRRSPAWSRLGCSRSQGRNRARGVRPISCQPPGFPEGRPRSGPGNTYGSGRDHQPGVFFRGWRFPAAVSHIGEARSKPDHVHQIIPAGVDFHHFFRGQVMILRHFFQIRSVFASVAHRDPDLVPFRFRSEPDPFQQGLYPGCRFPVSLRQPMIFRQEDSRASTRDRRTPSPRYRKLQIPGVPETDAVPVL